VTHALEAAVLSQLRDSTSIKDRSGVFAEFEARFAAYYGARHALLHSSGTMAIFAMFDALDLSPGDEIICPNYTWFATASPLAYLGLAPVFCDADDDGNLDPRRLPELVTERTRAVIVTHMWGLPCDMDPIVRFCSTRKLHLLEDCSHAHGASYRGRKVGAFGTASAWSLQAAKIVSAGEGGVLLTNEAEVYARATLTGHYNRRCKQEVPPDHPLREFWQTGFGLKLRAHPLGIAMANEQFNHLDDWIRQKGVFARRMRDAWSQFSFLRLPEERDRTPSWYVFAVRFDQERAGVSRQTFYRALVAEGLVDADVPELTGPIGHLPLFQKLHKVRPNLYRSAPRVVAEASVPVSWRIARETITFPVWARPEDAPIVERYIEGVRKVAEAVQRGELRD
jgi:dTDP-4-amino-4,6-dideoxygalactose transaminase